jgi:alpha-mannosidase
LVCNSTFSSVTNNKDKAYSRRSLYLFGNGDGGGGPLIPMLERLTRMSDLEGLPKVVFDSPDNFFDDLQETSKGLQEWRGELYFELHR